MSEKRTPSEAFAVIRNSNNETTKAMINLGLPEAAVQNEKDEGNLPQSSDLSADEVNSMRYEKLFDPHA